MNKLDIAFKITQELGPPKHLEVKDKLQKMYPNLAWDEIVELYSRAQDLLSEAGKLGFNFRDKKIDESQAIKTLIKTCPGFSEESYNKAWSHGLFESMW